MTSPDLSRLHLTSPDNLEMTKRKGAVRISEIPPAILAELNAGQIETVNLTEWLAVDQRQVMQNVLPALGFDAAQALALKQMAVVKKPSQLQFMPMIGAALLNELKRSKQRNKQMKSLMAHPSDMVRSWACFVIGLDDDLPLPEKLAALRPLAADENSGLRETVWMAVRNQIEAELNTAVPELAAWTQEPNAYLRRFASEATRPRGVWCKHIDALKRNPELGYAILEPLKSDSAKYVRDSVGNWLNDASKSQPDWVREICEHWTTVSPTAETAYIVKRALRTLNS